MRATWSAYVCLSVCVCGIEVSVTMTTPNFSLKKVQDVGAQTSVGLSKWFRLFPDLVVVCVCLDSENPAGGKNDVSVGRVQRIQLVRGILCLWICV